MQTLSPCSCGFGERGSKEFSGTEFVSTSCGRLNVLPESSEPLGQRSGEEYANVLARGSFASCARPELGGQACPEGMLLRQGSAALDA